jgi:hypothetical protein
VKIGDKPTVECAGCRQGFHEPCLETSGLGTAMTNVPGKLLWLCLHCKDNFAVFTTAGNQGKPSLRSKRLPPVLPAPTLIGDADTATAEISDEEAPSVEPGASGVDCALYLRRECPHGISGRKDGVCKDRHRKWCSQYMKWGDRGEKGCSVQECEMLHPELCPRSLLLKCVDQNCPHRLHTLKCVRAKKKSEPLLTNQAKAKETAKPKKDTKNPQRGGW